MMPFLGVFLGLFISLSAGAAENLPVFKRVIDNPSLGLLRTELAISEYECSYPNAFNLTLYPMIHIGEVGYYDTAQSRLSRYQVVFFESARPPGFFARIFDQVGPFPSSSEQELATLRLRSLRFFLNDFKSKYNRPAVSINEVLGHERGYLRNYLLDAKGAPFIMVDQGNLGLEFCFSTEPSVCSGDLPPADPITGLMDGLRAAYRLNAESSGLVAQHDVMSTDFANFQNADISYDLIFSQDTLWWELRNSYAVRVMSQYLVSKPLGKIAIQYGVGHFQTFHKLLSIENGCKLKQQEWQPIYRADSGLDIPKAQLEKRREMIEMDKNDP